MQACKRTTNDPVLTVFLRKYNLNLLSVPREGAALGDLYVYTSGRTSSPGQIGYFLEPPLKLPVAKTGECMADVQGMVTNAVSFTNGLELLEGFFLAAGSPALFQKLKAEYSQQKTHSFQFSFQNPVRDSIDPAEMGSKLIRHRFKHEHALVNEGNQYYLVTAIAKSSSISVIAETKSKTTVELSPNVLNLAKADAKIGVESSEAGKITFLGKKPLVFGVELYELTYDAEEKKLKMLMPKGAIKVRSGLGEPPNVQVVKPAFIGDGEGDAFFELN